MGGVVGGAGPGRPFAGPLSPFGHMPPDMQAYGPLNPGSPPTPHHAYPFPPFSPTPYTVGGPVVSGSSGGVSGSSSGALGGANLDFSVGGGGSGGGGGGALGVGGMGVAGVGVGGGGVGLPGVAGLIPFHRSGASSAVGFPGEGVMNVTGGGGGGVGAQQGQARGGAGVGVGPEAEAGVEAAADGVVGVAGGGTQGGHDAEGTGVPEGTGVSSSMEAVGSQVRLFCCDHGFLPEARGVAAGGWGGGREEAFLCSPREYALSPIGACV